MSTTTLSPDRTTSTTPAEIPPSPADPPGESYGAIVAALLAAGIGCAVFGACVVGAAASEDLEALLTVSESVGPLSGKGLAAVVVWLASWAVLRLLLRRRDVSFTTGFRLTLLLVGVGLVGTFPPVYERLMH
jgi:hypothetical protein